MGSSWISTDPRVVPSGRRVAGRVRVPGSKSATNRHLALAVLSGRPTVIRQPLLSDDIDRFLGVAERLGFRVERSVDEVRLEPVGPRPDEATLECGLSGTLLRFLLGLTAALPGRWTIDGASRLRERPVAPLIAALRRLGVRIDELGAPGHAPLVVHGGRFPGGSTWLDAGESSQYLSALLLAGTTGIAPLELRVPQLTSSPYVDLTVAAIERWGGGVARSGDRYRVVPAAISCPVVEVEGDDSSAAYPAAAAFVTGGRVEIEGLAETSGHGDRALLDLLARWGADVAWSNGRLVVRGSSRWPGLGRVDLGAMPDQAPTVAAIAALADGPTRITGAAHLRLKESDRIRSMATELGKLGFEVAETEDGLDVAGRPAVLPTAPAVVETWDDHRVAMSLAVLGLVRPNVSIADPDVVAKSYPSFWRDLDALLEGSS